MPGVRCSKREPGHDVYKMTPEQVTAWKNAAEPLNAKWAAGEGQRCGADEMQAELKARAG